MWTKAKAAAFPSCPVAPRFGCWDACGVLLELKMTDC